jgi:LuxR family maltose regulon positive regulatory protein
MAKARLEIARDDLRLAEEALQNAWQLLSSKKIPEATAQRVNVTQVRLLLAKNEPIFAWEDKLPKGVDDHSFYRFLDVTKARILPAPAAMKHLDALSQLAQSNGWIYGLIAVRALQAALAVREEDTLSFLQEALELGVQGGFVDVFLDAGPKLVPALREAAQRGISPEYVGNILHAMAEKLALTEADQSLLVEPLSDRELEVLRLITNGLSNREIAERLFISAGTAKSHVHHICGKLGVRNRTEAVTRAKEFGLV